LNKAFVESGRDASNACFLTKSTVSSSTVFGTFCKQQLLGVHYLVFHKISFYALHSHITQYFKHCCSGNISARNRWLAKSHHPCVYFLCQDNKIALRSLRILP